jgi:putative methyltransferase (TIGR04325 family)
MIKQFTRDLIPPLIWRTLRKLRSHPAIKFTPQEWEYISDGWRAAQADPKIKGWNVQDVLEAYKTKWPTFVKNLEGAMPFGISPEAILPAQVDLVFHNTIMCFAYALALSSRQKASISMLDWGGGIGHYFLISHALVPDLEIDYHCKDVPVLAEYGQTLFPKAHFYTDETCLERQYDFVLASTSLHYSQDWSDVLSGLARATAGYLFITRLPIVQHAPSFVFVQRPYQYGYNTEYLGWCLNRDEFLHHAADTRLTLVREFVTGEKPYIHRAPEQCEYRGYLFQLENT